MSPPGTREELLAHFRRMRQDMRAALAGLDDDALCEPSLDGWSVKDHLAHLAFWDDIRALEVERISAGHESTWMLTDEQDLALNDISYTNRRHLSLDQVRWELDRSHERLLAALEHATPRALNPALYGEAGLVSGHEGEHVTWITRWRNTRGL